LFAFSLLAFKWLFIIGFLTAFTNLPAFYKSFGFTPLSLFIDALPGPHTGAELYRNVAHPELKNQKLNIPKTPNKKKVNVNARNQNSKI
jgi:hypothetical protein